MGRPLDGLTLAERRALTGSWVALEIYTPERTPVRTIEAQGTSAAACVKQLRDRGLDPVRYEIVLIHAPYSE
jgi:hypothetical protein